MVRCENITVAFGDNIALNNISCNIEDGDFITIVGANGSGKSTLFDVIAGKIKPQSGNVFIHGSNVTCLDEESRALLVGRLFQDAYLGCVPSMTVKENLAIALYKGRCVKIRNALQSLSSLDILELLRPIHSNPTILLNTKMGNLSGGQRQMLSFLMATLIPPKIFLLDEPTAALDPTAATHLLAFAKEFIKKHSITTLLITHDPKIALRLGNKLWVMKKGRIIREFTGERSSLSIEELIGHIDYKIFE